MITQRLTLRILHFAPSDEAVCPAVIGVYANPSTEIAYVQADWSLADTAGLVRVDERARFVPAFPPAASRSRTGMPRMHTDSD